MKAVLMEIPGQTKRECKHLRRGSGVYIVYLCMTEWAGTHLGADPDLKQISPGVRNTTKIVLAYFIHSFLN